VNVRAWSWLALACLALTGCAGHGPATSEQLSAEIPADRQIIVAVHDERPRWQHRAGGIGRPYGGPAQYRGSAQARRWMADLGRLHDLRPVESWPIEMLGLYCVVFEIPPDQARDELLVRVGARPGVALAQPVQEFTTLAGSVDTPIAISAAGFAGEGIRHAHRWATGDGVTVALVDTGVDSSHPGLGGRVLREADFVGLRAIGVASESHGLAVAGVIAARADPQAGVVGIAPGAGLFAFRACWHTEPGTAVCNSFTLARAISAAVAHGAAIINLSLTGPPDPLLERLVLGAIERQHVVVGAVPDGSFTNGDHTAQARFPTSIPGVIAVRSAESAGAGGAVAVPAPGHNILTLRPGGGVGLASGSSLAAAHVSGVVALLLERRAGLAPDEIRALLREHTRPLALEGQGALELVNGCQAVASLVDGHCPAAVEWAAEAANPSARAPLANTAR
jgi:hypothetical protein